MTVLVTGATGFIAAHLVEQLLDAGYTVRGTARQAPPAGRTGLEYVVADLTRPGAFDEAVNGCDVVMHTASPYALTVKDPQRDLVDPAVNGTLNVLRACAKAPSVRRVVLTSSMAAITDEPPQDHALDESDWNTRSSLTRNPYYYSKTLAERTAWDFVERERPGFSLVAINPFMVVGPSLGPSLNVSNRVFADMLTGKYPGLVSLAWGITDVRDVARAHVLAMETPSARGRYLCAGDVLTMRDVVDLLRAHSWATGYTLPSVALPNWAVWLASWMQPSGVGMYLRTHIGRTPRYHADKIRRDLGLTFRPARDTILETVADLKRWGHI